MRSHSGPSVSDAQPYWAHRLVSSYQPIIEKDGDPSEEDVRWASTDGGHVDSLIFMEALSEGYKAGLNTEFFRGLMRELRSGVVAHEIGHALGGIPDPDSDHLEGGLMAKGLEEGNNETFKPITILRFRKVTKCTIP